MDNLDFKMNYYFEKLKDTSFLSRQEFRIMFKRRYGGFKKLDDLIKKIEEYQIKRYGCRLVNLDKYITPEERMNNARRSNQRRRCRLGKR